MRDKNKKIKIKRRYYSYEDLLLNEIIVVDGVRYRDITPLITDCGKEANKSREIVDLLREGNSLESAYRMLGIDKNEIKGNRKNSNDKEIK